MSLKYFHTYFTHIVNNYDNLADITLFLPGTLEIFGKKIKAIETLNYIILNQRANIRACFLPFVNKLYHN